MHVWVSVYVWMCGWMYVNMCVCMFMCVHSPLTHSCVYVYMHVCMYACVCTWKWGLTSVKGPWNQGPEIKWGPILRPQLNWHEKRYMTSYFIL